MAGDGESLRMAIEPWLVPKCQSVVANGAPGIVVPQRISPDPVVLETLKIVHGWAPDSGAQRIFEVYWTAPCSMIQAMRFPCTAWLIWSVFGTARATTCAARAPRTFRLPVTTVAPRSLLAAHVTYTPDSDGPLTSVPAGTWVTTVVAPLEIVDE